MSLEVFGRERTIDALQEVFGLSAEDACSIIQHIQGDD